MNFLIADAWAQEGSLTGGAGVELLIMVAVFFLIMYLLIIRPQNKRNKSHRTMLSSLSKGDEVVTTGGMLGKVSEITENFITVEVQEGTVIKIQRQAIASVMPKGTIRSA